jgi:hypothetical protein
MSGRMNNNDRLVRAMHFTRNIVSVPVGEDGAVRVSVEMTEETDLHEILSAAWTAACDGDPANRQWGGPAYEYGVTWGPDAPCDSGRPPEGEDARSAAECEAGQSGARSAIAQTVPSTPSPIDSGGDDDN